MFRLISGKINLNNPDVVLGKFDIENNILPLLADPNQDIFFLQ